MTERTHHSTHRERAGTLRRWAVAACSVAACWLAMLALAQPAAAQSVQAGGTLFPVTAGRQNVTSQTVTLTANVDDVVIQSVAVSSGYHDSEFYLTDPGTCAAGTYVSAGTSCTFTVAFNPQAAGYAQAPAPIGRWAQVNLVYTDQVSGGNVYVNYPLIGSGSGVAPVISPGVISDIVGNDANPQVGFAGDGGQASNAIFSSPSAIAMDNNSLTNPYGNLYIVDGGNDVVRVVYEFGTVPNIANPVAGNIYTIAGVAPTGGSAQPGAGQDTVLATQSHLNAPTGVAVDALGDIYIADTGNNAIRMVAASTGYITTVAGTLNAANAFAGDTGPATSAQLAAPAGISVDGYGNIYIADNGNQAIRVVYQGGAVLANLIATENPGSAAAAGNIYTVAGGSANPVLPANGDGGLATLANLSSANAVIVDSSGDIYIADFAAATVRRVDAVTGNISTIQQGGDNPGSLAVDASDNIYFTNHNSCTVSQYNPTLQAGLAAPYTSVVAGNGTCTVSGDGGSATSAGLGGAVGVGGLNGVVVDGVGNLFLLEADGVRFVNSQQSPFNFGTVPIGSSGDLSAVLTDLNILPPAGSQSAIDIENPSFLVPANSITTYFSVIPFLGANPNIADCNAQYDGPYSPTPTYVFLRPGQSCGVQVQFQPLANGGPYTGSATQPGLNGNYFPSPALLFSGSGGGSLPTANLTGPATPFVSGVNTSSATPQLFTLTNTGTSPLQISAISFSYTSGAANGSFSETDTCGPAQAGVNTLAPGASCQITVMFSATAVGSVVGTLQVKDNASTCCGVQSLRVYGTGVSLPTTVTLTASPQALPVGGGIVTLTATVNPPAGYPATAAPPSGWADLYVNEGFGFGPASSYIERSQLSGGVATFGIDVPSYFSYIGPSFSVEVIYEGDSTFTGSSAIVPIVIGPALVNIAEGFTFTDAEAPPAPIATATQLAVTPSIVSMNAPTQTVTGTVAPVSPSATPMPVPTGTVTFTVNPGAHFAGNVSLSTGAFSGAYNPGTLPTGSYTIQAVYSGDYYYAPSTSILVPFSVTTAENTYFVTPQNEFRSFGTSNPTLGYTIQDGLGGAVGFSGEPSITTTATLNSPAGTYPITATTGTLATALNSAFAFVPGTLTVTGGASHVIKFTPIPNIPSTIPAITLTAHSTSGLPIVYTVTGPATLSGSVLSLTGTGTVTVTASQPGNATFAPATPIVQSFTVTP